MSVKRTFCRYRTVIVVFRIREKFFLPINMLPLACSRSPVLSFSSPSFFAFLSSPSLLSPSLPSVLPLSACPPSLTFHPMPPPRPFPQSYVSCCLHQWLSSPCLSLSPTVLHTHFLISFHYHQVILQFLLSLCFTVLLPCQRVNAFFRLLIKQKSEIWLTK